MVATKVLEPLLEPVFLEGSYGYRNRRSALQAVGKARERCWRYDWVIEMDIKGFFDNLDHTLVEKAVAHHTDLAWVKLYIGRWLRAPLQKADGTLVERTKGTPQGGVISPLLANLFLHYAFDAWITRTYPGVPFERYADDAIVHCGSVKEAAEVLEAIRKRFAECALELHPEKTRIVYCKDDDRPGNAANTSFDFLGFTFRPRGAKSRRGKFFLSFLPAMSDEAANSVRGKIRAWKLPSKRCSQSMEEIARFVNPSLNGWLNYFGKFYRSRCTKVLSHFNDRLAEWARRKYKGLSHGLHFLGRVARQSPRMFALWKHGVMPAAGG
jgi:group II intron reverse transcriptase/maturase